ncbi:MAG TPA: hypothetical protein ENK75_06515, partial [Saprospiraceae bacterium]|nr:hypothetical protein [Saprospiraceae bacterium]
MRAKERIGKSQFNLDISYRFNSLGAGISLGSFTHETSGITYNMKFPTRIEGGNISGFYYGLGPNYHLSLGKISLSTMFRGGFMNLDVTNFTADYNGEDAEEPITILETTLNPKNKKSTPYSSLGIRFSYPCSNKLSLFTKADYLIALGEKMEFTDSYYLPFDADANQNISIFDVEHFTQRDYLKTETRVIKPQMFNLGIGLSYTFPPTKATDWNSTRSNKTSKTTRVGNPNNGGTPNPIHATDWNSTRSNKTSKTTRMANPNEQPRKIVLLTPKDGQHYKDGKMPKMLKWKVVGKPFTNPVYIIEMRNMQTKAIKIAKSKTTQIDAHKLFDTDKPSRHYIWRVTEQGSGIGGGPANLFFDNCDFTMSVDNVSIDCKGYEGANRKYEVCFDVNYQSSVGDLTFNNSGSGLFVEDQSNNALNYTLTGSNTSLQTQTGATQSTVHYCFETTVNSSVNSINFGLQGDDLDPGTLTCQPGAGNGVRDLPDCLCDECDQITINTDGLEITQNSQSPGIYNLTGNLNVNIPIYGVEFQFTSLDYNAAPNSCSQGVTDVESSGIFLQSGSTINNSSSIQFFNESASQSPNSNTNASKDIKYMSNTALSGAIPINLSIGVPQPLQGLNTNCCQMDYTVC